MLADEDNRRTWPVLPQTSGIHHSDLHLEGMPDQGSGRQHTVLPQSSGVNHPDHCPGGVPDQDSRGKPSLLSETSRETVHVEPKMTVTSALGLIATAYMD